MQWWRRWKNNYKMMKFNKKSGFSLAESIISMMLLVFVIMLTMASITKKKTKPISTQTVSGSYACWHDGSRFHQLQYNGNLKVTTVVEYPASCEFEMDRRVRQYYVIAVGSRRCDSGKCVDGQVVEKPIANSGGEDESKMKLEIKLGNNDDTHSGTTIVKFPDEIVNIGGTSETKSGEIKVSAMGGAFYNKSGIVPGNMELCKYIDNNPCTEGKPQCTVGPNGETISVSCVNSDNITLGNAYTIEEIGEKLTKLSGNGDKYLGKFKSKIDDFSETSLPETSITVKIQERDSSFKAIENPDPLNSEFGKFLRMIPLNRTNGLTDELSKYYFLGGYDKNGVVLILW